MEEFEGKLFIKQKLQQKIEMLQELRKIACLDKVRYISLCY